MLELLALDDRGQEATAVQVARRLLDDNSVVAVVGHAQSTTTIAAASIYESGSEPVAVVSPTASSIELSRSNPKVYRVCPDDVAHAERLAEWARSELVVRRVAVLYHNDRDSRTSAAAFREAFTNRGGTILAEDPFSPALPSFEPYLTRASRRGRLDAVLIVGGGPSIGPMLASLDSMESAATIMGRIDLLRHAQAAGRDMEGSILSAPYLSDRGGPVNDAFLTSYMQSHGGQRPDHTAAGTYDIVHLIARGIERRGATRGAIRSYLSGLGTDIPPFEGATGIIGFDDHGNLQRFSIEIGVVRDGAVVPASVR
jgi:branched-chain amino acid transport system substrate-binding protein